MGGLRCRFFAFRPWVSPDPRARGVDFSDFFQETPKSYTRFIICTCTTVTVYSVTVAVKAWPLAMGERFQMHAWMSMCKCQIRTRGSAVRDRVRDRSYGPQDRRQDRRTAVATAPLTPVAARATASGGAQGRAGACRRGPWLHRRGDNGGRGRKRTRPHNAVRGARGAGRASFSGLVI